MRIYGFIASEKTSYPVRLLCRVLCRVLGVSASAFYAWAARDGEPGPQAKRDAARIVLIRQAWTQAWTEHRQVYGARRLTAELHE
jgi:putative transposase